MEHVNVKTGSKSLDSSEIILLSYQCRDPECLELYNRATWYQFAFVFLSLIVAPFLLIVILGNRSLA